MTAQQREHRCSCTEAALGARWGWMISPTTRPLCHREAALKTTVQETEWKTAPVWTGVEKRKSLFFSGARTPNFHPVAGHYTAYATRSHQCLYQLYVVTK